MNPSALLLMRSGQVFSLAIHYLGLEWDSAMQRQKHGRSALLLRVVP